MEELPAVSDYNFEEFIARSNEWAGGYLKYQEKASKKKVSARIFDIAYKEIGTGTNLFMISTDRGQYGFNSKKEGVITRQEDGLWILFNNCDGSTLSIKKQET